MFMLGFGHILLSSGVMVTEEVQKLKKLRKPIFFFFLVSVFSVFCFCCWFVACLLACFSLPVFLVCLLFEVGFYF